MRSVFIGKASRRRNQPRVVVEGTRWHAWEAAWAVEDRAAPKVKAAAKERKVDRKRKARTRIRKPNPAKKAPRKRANLPAAKEGRAVGRELPPKIVSSRSSTSSIYSRAKAPRSN